MPYKPGIMSLKIQNVIIDRHCLQLACRFRNQYTPRMPCLLYWYRILYQDLPVMLLGHFAVLVDPYLRLEQPRVCDQ